MTPERPHPLMPPRAPMAMPVQNLSRTFIDPQAPAPRGLTPTRHIMRHAMLWPAIAVIAGLITIFVDWFSPDGLSAFELAIIAIVALTAFWIAISVSTSLLGWLSPPDEDVAGAEQGLDIALLVPVFNEDADAVFARIRAMMADLARTPTAHRFSFHVLSDTRDEATAARERQQAAFWTHDANHPVPLHYRRRAQNTDRKTGNIADWMTGWGAAHEAFITLDADSIMSARAIIRLADTLAASPRAALIQSVPRLVEAGSAFARVQQFANNIYGGVLARGLRQWAGPDGNYWGHNAIIRTAAFAACCGLPRLSGRGATGGTIKSHDFVEAALLRRAGWEVRLLPDIAETYEGTPQTLIDYVIRDRRWCQGNLQHLRLLAIPGLPLASRFHMLQGAMAYIASVGWFALLVVWVLMGVSADDNVVRYFTDANPLFPVWPHVDAVSRWTVVAVMAVLLLAPKVIALTVTLHAAKTGRAALLLSAASEIVLSILLAPIMMVQHVSAVLRTVVGIDTGWNPQSRDGDTPGWLTLLRFHGAETTMGIALAAGMAAGLVSLWLLPIAVSLCLAVPLSWAVSLRLSENLHGWMATRETLAPPPVLQLTAQAEGAQPA